MAKRLNDQAKGNLKVVGLVGVGLVLLTGVVWFFLMGGDEKRARQVVVPPASPELAASSAPDAGAASFKNEAYKKAIEEDNRRKAEEAKAKGGTSVPSLTPPGSEKEKEQPAREVGGHVGGDGFEKPAGANKAYDGGVPPPPGGPGGGYTYGQGQPREDTSRARVVMDELVKQWELPSQKFYLAKKTENTSAQNKEGAVVAVAASGASQQSSAAGAAPSGVLIEKGTMCYAVIESAINSDEDKAMVTGVLASCRGKSGDSFNGGRIYGNIERSGESVIVRFSLMNHLKRGYSINAIAFDEKSARGALSGKVDRHTFVRYWLPVITDILAGWGQASSRDNTSTVVNLSGTTTSQGTLDDKSKIAVAIGKGGETISKILQDANKGKEITVEIPRNVGVGILFLGDVAPGV